MRAAERMGRVRKIRQSQKLRNVRYDVRGPILVEAHRLEAEGHRILKLNIGNPAPFGFEAPEAILADVIHHLPESQGYSDSQGIYSARTAVAQYYQARGLRETDVDDVFIGNGVSELISMVLQAFVDDGNEILVPAPDYPLWTGAVSLSGTLAIGRVSGYTPLEGESWTILTAGSLTGTFDTITGTLIAADAVEGDLVFAVSYTATAVVLTATRSGG